MNLNSTLRAALDGDAQQRERLLALTRPTAVRWASTLVSEGSEDVAQEALLEVWAKLEDLREPEAFLAWVHLVVRKHADRHRRRTRRVLALDLVLDVPDARDGPDEVVVRRDAIASVRQALERAPDQDQKLLDLRYRADWSDSQLAELLGISPGAVRKRLHDARRRLRPVLAAALERPTQNRRPLVTQRFGVINEATSGTLAPRVPVLDETPLVTGIRVIDGLLPWPRAGLIDLMAPARTGTVVLLSEALTGLLAGGPAALVAVCATGSESLLPMLVTEESGQPDRSVVVRGEPEAALASAVATADELAREGLTVLLVVDEEVAKGVGRQLLATVPLALAHGSVTVIRCANWSSGDPEAVPLPDAHTRVRLSHELAALGVYPAVDLLQSSSVLADPQLAKAAREQLLRAKAVQQWIAQPFVTASAYTGVPGERVTAHEAEVQLRAALAVS